MLIIFFVGSITACFIRIKIQVFISGRTLNMTLLKGITVTLKKKKMTWWNGEMAIKGRKSSKICKRKKYGELQWFPIGTTECTMLHPCCFEDIKVNIVHLLYSIKISQCEVPWLLCVFSSPVYSNSSSSLSCTPHKLPLRNK